jgi:hypothetical protein
VLGRADLFTRNVLELAVVLLPEVVLEMVNLDDDFAGVDTLGI